MLDKPSLPTTYPFLRVNYGPEDCAWCQGTGGDGDCTACTGSGKILVAQPSIKCPRCGGSGKASDSTVYSFPLCAVCFGAGWALIMK